MHLNKKYLLLSCLLIFVLVCTTACGPFQNKKKEYRNYVQNLMDVNYKAKVHKFARMTNSSDEDVQQIYEDGMVALTNAFIEYYGVSVEEGSDLFTTYEDIVKELYGKTRYEVSKAKKDGDSYTVAVTIYPLDILSITDEEVKAYIEGFQTRKDEGYYDEYDKEQYASEFAQGIADILKTSIDQTSYTDAVTVDVPIEISEDSYTISSDSFLALDHALIASPSSSASEDSKEDTDTSSEE